MPKLRSPNEVILKIEKLLQERSQHEEAITRIDEMLGRAGDALGTMKQRGRRAETPLSAPHAPVITRRRRRRKFDVSAEESILAFVKERKNPTTQEIKKHWTGEGRGGTADNALSLLVKTKKLKRTPLEGQRGSRYSIV